VQLERLVVRDGLTFEEAYETLRTNFHVTESRTSLEEMTARFPVRTARRFVPDDALEEHMSSTLPPDTLLEVREAVRMARGTSDALGAALGELPPQDRLILKMRFQDGFSIADTARALHLDQKPLYRRLERLLGDLRQRLEAAGISAEAAGEVLHQRGFDGLADSETAGEVRPFSKGHSPVQNARRP
jgi:RNA polymerase sigma factor for flagellar operon FliA